MSAVELRDGFIRVVDAERTYDFHLRWLRHNCDVDRHPSTGERTIDSADLPDVLGVDEIAVVDDVVKIRWAHEDRVSRFPLPWLRAHAYATDRRDTPRPPSEVASLEIVDSRAPATLAADVLGKLAQRGAVIVRREVALPEDETEAWIEALRDRGLRLTATHFGRIEDLRTDNTTNANTDQLGYTDAAIELHTDQPFLDRVPRYQLLQAVRAADEGGESLLADAEAAFAYLGSLDRDAANRLATTPVRFHRRQREFEREVLSPIVRTEPFQIRSSYFTLAPYRLPFVEMEGWYRASDRFVRILRDPRNHYRFSLRPGDVLIYDNHRMVHGRTGFRGPRWVRGVYFDPPLDDIDTDRSG